MQQLNWPFCGINFTFLKDYNICQFATDHDYPVPVDKHESDKKLPHPLTP